VNGCNQNELLVIFGVHYRCGLEHG